MHPAAEGLFTALETVFSDVLGGRKKRVIFLRAALHPKLSKTMENHSLRCEQSYKPAHSQLEQAGFKTYASLAPKAPVDVVVYLPTRNREENKFNMARGLEMLKEGGVFITAQHNTLGAKHLEKDLKELVPELVPFSKKHCRVLKAEKPADLDPMQTQLYLAYGNPEVVAGTKLSALPGLFSWKKPDTGSQMLVDMIDPADLAGHGADFGSGWGFLARRALKMSPRIRELHLLEAEKLALDISVKNLKEIKKVKIIPHWADVPNYDCEQTFDFILCNPPQHTISNTDTPLAIQFIEKAARSLKDSGCLWLVTNHHIPADKHLRRLFHEVEECNRDKQYKVFRAAEPKKSS